MRPPVDIKIPGIPYKKRKIGHDEYYTEKKVRSSTRCKHTGHNKRTCGGAHVGSNPKGKRQRTIVDGGSHTTSYPDPAELSTSRSLSRRGRGGRGRRGGRGAASSSSTSVSASPSTTSGRGSRGGRGGR
ncbi:hypothetical protein MKX01_012400 [Papaver californicum]|nr:hypothetical protein MKX01_012400 [Papaver californicum]